MDSSVLFETRNFFHIRIEKDNEILIPVYLHITAKDLDYFNNNQQDARLEILRSVADNFEEIEKKAKEDSKDLYSRIIGFQHVLMVYTVDCQPSYTHSIISLSGTENKLQSIVSYSLNCWIYRLDTASSTLCIDQM